MKLLAGFGVFLLMATGLPAQPCPQLVGSCELPDGPPWYHAGQGVTVAGDTAYVAAGEGLLVVDVSKPEEPVLLASLSTPGSAKSVVATGSTVYLADGTAGVRIIDVSKPTSPLEVGFFQTTDSALDVAMAGGYLLVAADSAGLLVLDVGDPVTPFVAGRLETALPALTIDLSDNYALVGLGALWCFDGALLIVDLSDPCHPKQVGALPTSGCVLSSAGSGDIVYFTDVRTQPVSWPLFHVIDISKPAAPLWLAGFWGNNGVATSNDIVFLADGPIVIDVSIPESPVILYTPGYGDFGANVAIVDGYAFVAGWDQAIEVYDITSCPTSLLFLDSFETGNTTAWSTVMQ